MAELPLHLAVLDKLTRDNEARRQQHLEKCGMPGLEIRSYRELTGRIAELKHLLASIQELRARLVGDEDALDEEADDEDTSHRAKRRGQSAR